MRVLVSCKTTNLDVHGESVRKKTATGFLAADHLQRLQEDHGHHHRSRQKLLQALDAHSISYVEVGRGQFWPDLAEIQAVITVGGDGTVLEASHHIHAQKVPLIGVRSSPMSVGYLCSCGEEGIEEVVANLAARKLKTVKVHRLFAKVQYSDTGGQRRTDPILNDFLYANANPAATTRYKFRMGGREEVQKSSGIWIATPAGSSAAISTAGGEELTLTERDFQYVVRELYQPSKEKEDRFQKGFFDPDHCEFLIENRCEKAILAVDGQHGLLRLGFGDKVTFHRAAPLSLAQPEEATHV